jgi:hypothetical protein
MRKALKCLTTLVVLLVPATVLAQASLTGTVRDVSGGVIPGVTVEAASPALIEKVRTAVTNDSGQYRIIDLRPGTYSLTFTLPGFSTVRRDNINLTGSQTLTIPVVLRVGGLDETITVTGDAPVVDVQNARREVVIDRELVETIPASRAAGALLNATPGLSVTGGGLSLSPTMTFFSANGGAINEGRMTVNGMTVGAARSGGVSSYVYDSVGLDEVAVRVGGGLGETDTGGPIMNIVPRSGGNSFDGTVFTSLAGDWSRGDNLNDELRSFGITETPGIIQAHDASFSIGGPIVRDRLWFYGSYRNLSTQTAVEGITANANMGDANRWDWMPSATNARLVQDRQMMIGRLAAQLGRSRLQGNYEYQKRCEGTPLRVGTEGCHNRGEDWIGLGTETQSPEATGTAGRGYFEWPFHLTQAQWTMPATSRLLFDANMTVFRYNPAFGFPPPDGVTSLIRVTEQSTALRCVGALGNMANPGCADAEDPSTLQWAPRGNYAYRALDQWGYAEGATNSYNASAAYVTGAHNVRAGYQYYWLRQLDNTIAAEPQLAYRFNRGVPNAVSYRLPEWSRNSITQLHGIFIQDQYTRGRLTLSGALRWDRASSYAPVDGNGVSITSPLNPTPITIERTTGVDAFNDITPRVGIGYDVFGNGRTAVKFRWGRYLAFASNDTPFTSKNPAATLVATVTNRGWTDSNGNLAVDCDLLNTASQNLTGSGGDICAAAIGNSANFGNIGAATTVDPEILSGWKVRPHDYQTEITVQQEVIPRVSAELSYIHRTFHGFFVTQNLNRDVTTDYASYTINAPMDPRLPGGGGYPILVYAPIVTGAADNFLTHESRYSSDGHERDAYFDGVNFNVNARMRGGLFVSAGTQTGRRVDDQCNVQPFLTGGGGPNPRGCFDADPWQTTVRGLGSYTIPRIDVLVSATVRSEPPLQLDAEWAVPNTCVGAGCVSIQNALGFLPPGTNPNGNTTIDLFDDTMRLYADNRRTQVDMRFAKVFRFGGTRTDIGVDLWNLFNTNYATGYEDTYSFTQPNGGQWIEPTSIYAPRFVRLNFTVNF